MRRELFQPTPAGEVRLLLLIDAFTGTASGLEGRTKLAKLDFFLRYSTFLKRALEIRQPDKDWTDVDEEGETIESKMVRYRYGPWDPAYYALLGSLIGRGLIYTLPKGNGREYMVSTMGNGREYMVSTMGKELANEISQSDSWSPIVLRSRLLKRHLNLSGTSLKNFIYENFPEVSQANWGSEL